MAEVADWAASSAADDGRVADERARAGELPAGYETEVGPDGLKEIVSFKKTEDGRILKVVKRVRVTKVKKKINTRIQERRSWHKFGRAYESGPGPEEGFTVVEPAIKLELSLKGIGGGGGGKEGKSGKEAKKGSAGATEQILKDGLKNITCRHCGGPHWTIACPYKHIPKAQLDAEKEERAKAEADGTLTDVAAGLQAAMTSLGVRAEGAGDDTDKLGQTEGKASSSNKRVSGLGGKSGSYVPPALRAGASSSSTRGASGGGGRSSDRDLCTVKISNLDEDTQEDELRALFGRFGGIQRCFVAKHRESGKAKGFAFITYYNREDAAKAVQKLDQYAFMYTLISVEFAPPRD